MLAIVALLSWLKWFEWVFLSEWPFIMPFEDTLSPELIIAAYRGGFFPMPDPDTGEIFWYNPDPRAVLPLDCFHISKSLRRTSKKQDLKITFDCAFAEVVEGCADRSSTWISPLIKESYVRLFHMGYAHSVEVWNRKDGKLVGGLYGVAQGAVFNAESMFSRVKDASKLALWALVQRMRECEMSLLEVQFLTPHLQRLGAVNIKKIEYIQILKSSLEGPGRFLKPEGEYRLV